MGIAVNTLVQSFYKDRGETSDVGGSPFTSSDVVEWLDRGLNELTYPWGVESYNEVAVAQYAAAAALPSGITKIVSMDWQQDNSSIPKLDIVYIKDIFHQTKGTAMPRQVYIWAGSVMFNTATDQAGTLRIWSFQEHPALGTGGTVILDKKFCYALVNYAIAHVSSVIDGMVQVSAPGLEKFEKAKEDYAKSIKDKLTPETMTVRVVR